MTDRTHTRADADRVLTISAASGMSDLLEAWRFRELLYVLAWRDVKVRYKQTTLGVLWVLVQPLALTAVFTIFLGRYVNVPSAGPSYAVFVLNGLLAWQLFASGINESANSVLANERLVTKVYFPMILLPAAAVIVATLDFAMASGLLVPWEWAFGVRPTVALVAAPAFAVQAAACAAGAGLWLAALNVQYRDVRYVMPYLTQLWMFATPVVYPASVVPAAWQALYAINPMVGVLEGFRWALTGGAPPPATILFISALSCLFMLATGLRHFLQLQDTFADRV